VSLGGKHVVARRRWKAQPAQQTHPATRRVDSHARHNSRIHRGGQDGGDAVTAAARTATSRDAAALAATARVAAALGPAESAFIRTPPPYAACGSRSQP